MRWGVTLQHGGGSRVRRIAEALEPKDADVDVDVRTINYHLKKIFADSELQEDSVIRKFRITAADGKTYGTKHYKFSAVIAVG